MRETFAEKLNGARLLLAGLKAHKTEVSGVGLDEKKVGELEKLLHTLEEMDAKQEKLKAELKTCTAELSEKSKEMTAMMSDAKKRVKLAIEPTLWKEFGFSDKK